MKRVLKKIGGWRYVLIICIYLAICLTVIAFSFRISDSLVLKNNLFMMDNTISLMVEKMNNSINVMTGYVEEASALLSSQGNIDFETRYKEIKETNAKLSYMSLGFIGIDGKMYCGAAEKKDFDKYGFVGELDNSESVYITKPYRALGTGTNVMTMFDTIYNGEQPVGYVFVTYPLEQIQSITNTGVLEKEAEVYIMNGASGNYIRCTKTEDYEAGSWNNIFMEKKNMIALEGYDVDKWQRGMVDGDDSDTICFNMGEKLYTQAYKRIDNMEGWYIVVRIPSQYLSSNINATVKVLGVTLVVLLAATLMFASILLRNEVFQKNKLREISIYDELTKVLNRRAFYGIMQSYKENKRRKKGTLIFFDMDEFKPINDVYGHDVGDKVLIKFASLLKKVFEDYAAVVRMGGDEFVVFFENGDTRDFVDKRIAVFRKLLNEAKIEGADKINMSCSIGVASYPSDTSDPDRLEKCADKALYHVKNNGKNYTCWYSDLDEK